MGTLLPVRALLVVAALAVSSTADARDLAPSEIRTRVEDINAMLGEFESSPHADEVRTEIRQATLEIGEIQAKLSQDDVAGAQVTLNLLEARLGLIESAVQRALVEDLANERESELIAIQQEADQLQIDLTTAQQRREQLQGEVQQIIDAVETEQ